MACGLGSSFGTESITKPLRLTRFLLGTNAQVHLTARKECFLTLTELHEPIKFTDATGSIVLTIARGEAMIPVFFDNTITWLKLNDVYYAPYLDAEQSLISVSGLYASGITVEWKSDADSCFLLDDSSNVVARGSSRGHKWYLDVDLDLIRYNNPDIQDPPSVGSSPETPDMMYPESIIIQSLNSMDMFEDELYPSIEEYSVEDGDACADVGADGDSSDCPEDDCSLKDYTSTTSGTAFSLVYSDFYGPLSVSVGGNRYAVSFVDNYSHFARIYFVRSPAGYLAAVKSFVDRTGNDSGPGYKLKTLHTGGEEGNISAQIATYLLDRGIVHRATFQRPSIARQFNHALFNRVQTMLPEAKIEHGWWEDAAAMAVYIFNRTPNPLLDFRLPVDVQSQPQKGPGTTPTTFVYRPFGSICTATLVDTKGGKEFRREFSCRVLRFDTGAGEWVVLTLEGDRIFSTKIITFVDPDDECD